MGKQQMKNKFKIIVLVLVATFTLNFISGQNTYAEDGAAGSAYYWGTQTNTSGRGRYGAEWGATWVYYRYIGENTGDIDVRHIYASGSTQSGWSASVNWVRIPAKCREFGGFYVLVNFEHDDSGNYTGGTYGTQKLAKLKQYGGNYEYRMKGDPNVPWFIGMDRYTDDFGNGAESAEWGESLATVEEKFNSLSDEAKRGYTWGRGSELDWFCYGNNSSSGSNIHSTSAVTFNGATQVSDLDSKTTMVVPSSLANSSSTAVFTHRIVSDKDPTSGLSLVNVGWSIGGAYASSNNTPSGVLNLGSDGWTARADGKWEKVVSTSTNVPVGTSGLVCQTITYNPKSYAIAGSNVSGSGTGSSTACINLRPVSIPTPTCAALGGVSTKTINYGDTNGASRVMNANNLTGDTGWRESVWARPGDTVSFAHCFSWGVQAVRKSDDYGGGRTTPSEASSVSDRVGESSFTISSDRGYQYLFGARRDQGSIGQYITLQRFNPTAYRLNGGYINAESNGNYELVLMSPSKENVDINRYNCLIYDFTQFINYGFQIPGMTTGGCAASNATGRTNEVGTTISQRITYPYQQAWVHESWSHSGTCNCSATSTSQGDSTYYNNQNLGYPGGNGSIATDRFGSVYASQIPNCYDTSCGLYQYDLNCPGIARQNGCNCDDPGDDYDYDCSWDECTARALDGSCTNSVHHSQTCHYHRGSTIGGCHGWNSYGVIGTRHPVHYANYGNRTSVASVNIPYNFRTADTSSINSGSVIYAGETVSSMFTASVLPVINSSIKSTSSAYATVYPGDIRIEQFIIGPDAPIPAQTSGVLPIGNSMCSYFGGTQCGTIGISNTGGNWKNAQGRYNGWTWSMSATYNVPNNTDIGSKYCVAIGMTVASSHADPDAQTVSGWQVGSIGNTNWRVSLSCRTIAKKPNFQAWNANLYTQEGADTTIASKYEDAALGTNSSPNRIFGSWEEYLLISKNSISGLASGAALGYEGSTMRITGGHAPTSSFCDLSHMSISNENCNYVGFSRISIGTGNISRIATRYNPSSMEVNSGENINVASARQLSNTATGGRTGEYIMTSGNGVINSTIIRGANSPVLVIRVPGTLTINSNICYGSGSCNGYSNYLALGDRNSQRFSSISEIPQVIIIASQINISENVTQLDAWLIALGTPGTVNTCYQFNKGSSSSDTCSKTLIVNGPTITNHLLLNRTAGAYTRSTFGQNDRPGAENNLTDDGSMTPAEIFNYRPDTLLWGYQQSQNFSQATVTYSRELSPRY